MANNYNTILSSVKKKLGANYIPNTDEVITEIIEMVEKKACNITHLKAGNEDLIPYIKDATIAEYNQRGAEGMNTRNEGGVSSGFFDIVEKMRKDLIKNGLRRVK